MCLLNGGWELPLLKVFRKIETACLIIMFRELNLLQIAQNHARKLAETPANMMTPTIFAETAQKILSELKNPNITVNVHDRDWAVEQKMGAFLSVGRGSEEPLKFLEIIYNGGDSAETYVGLVGKGKFVFGRTLFPLIYIM